MEEATGTWCGWCPRGTVGMAYMEDTYPETFVGIAVHNSDPMEVVEYDSNLGVGGYPSSHVDRAVLDTDPNAQNLESLHNQRIDAITPIAVNQDITYDQNTRELSVNVNATSATSATVDYRTALVLTEDGVTGVGSGYAQANFYSGGAQGPMGGYENLGDPVPAADMVYDHVARVILDGFYGTTGSIPADVMADGVYTQTYDYTIPDYMNDVNINVIAMVLDGETGQILNADKVHLSDFIVSTNEVFDHSLAEVFPNPFSDVTNIRLKMTEAADVNIRVMNAVGQLIEMQEYTNLAGDNIIPFSGAGLANGMYYIHITIGDTLVTKKVMLSR